VGSIWDTVNGIQPRNYTHWPNPFPAISNIRVLACENDFIILTELLAPVAVHFFFTHFVPSPVEITRKLISGSYKCGLYLPIKVRSPLDLIWADGSAAKAVSGISSPVTTGLFGLWAASTLMEGLEVAHTLILAMQMCRENAREAIMIQGHAYFPSPEMTGSPGLYTTTWDPLGKCDPIPGDIRYSPGGVTADAFGYLVNTGSTIIDAHIYLIIGGDIYGEGVHLAPGIGDRSAFHLSAQITEEMGGDVQVRMHIIQENPHPFSTLLQVTQFIVSWGPFADFPTNGPNPYPPDPCRAAGMPPQAWIQ